MGLKEMIELLGENIVKRIISEYCCPINLDSELFLKEKAIEYEKRQSIKSRTYFVGFVTETGQFIVLGYFTLVNLPFEISSDMSNSNKRRFTYGQTNRKFMSAVLIGQFGKNFYEGMDSFMKGSELMKLVLETIVSVDEVIGLNLIYLECEDTPKLRQFYESNGFRLNTDKNGNPIMTGRNKDLLCYVAKFDDLYVE